MTCSTSSGRWSKSRSSCWTSMTTADATGCWKRSVTMRARSSNRAVNRQRRPRDIVNTISQWRSRPATACEGPSRPSGFSASRPIWTMCAVRLRWRWRGGVDPFIAVKMAVALEAFWTLRGYATEGRDIVRSALALPAVQASDLAQAWALYVGAGLAESQSDYAEARKMSGRVSGAAAPTGKPDRHRGHAVDLVSGSVASAVTPEARARANSRHCRSSENSAIDEAKRSACFISGRSVRTSATMRRRVRTLRTVLHIAREIKYQEIEGESELLLGGGCVRKR